MIPIGFVYKITNLINGKIYFGITKLTIKKRWKEHINNALRNRKKTRLCSSMKKHGIENFKINLHKTCYSDFQLYNSEIFFIKDNNTTNRSFGYNISTGGEMSAKGRKPSPEAIEKFRLLMIGRTPWNKGTKGLMPVPHNKGVFGVVKISESHRLKLKEVHSGKQYTLGMKRPLHAIEATKLKNTGKKRTEEQKERISKSLIGNPALIGGRKNKGKIRTEENKKRISETLKARSDNKGSFHKMAKINEEIVLKIRQESKFNSSRDLASIYGLSKTNILDIKNRKIWKHV